MADSDVRAIVSGTLVYLVGYLAALIATVAVDVVLGSILPAWVSVDLLAGLAAAVSLVRW